jgi:hypothetical protein
MAKSKYIEYHVETKEHTFIFEFYDEALSFYSKEKGYAVLRGFNRNGISTIIYAKK